MSGKSRFAATRSQCSNPFPTSHIIDSKLRICVSLTAVTAGCCRKPELISLYSRHRCCFGPKIRCVQCQSEKRCCPPRSRSAGQSLPDFVEQCRFSNLAGWAVGSPVTAAGLHGTRQIYHFAMIRILPYLVPVFCFGVAVLIVLGVLRAINKGELPGKIGRITFRDASPISFWFQIAMYIMIAAFFLFFGVLTLPRLGPNWFIALLRSLHP